MSALGEILSFLASGSRVPDQLASTLSDEEATAVRNLEQRIESHQRWRVMSMKLLEVSHMLNSGRDSETIFRTIVGHARSLIGADIGYISLNDDATGFTRVLSTSGAVTKAFRNISMPIGTGVLGLVVASDAPVWTSDHSTDPQVTHVDFVDSAVIEEGVHGILGAPIKVHGSPIGALMVADRRPRNYRTEDIIAVELLGSIAAVAIETAQVIEQQRYTVAELTSSRDELGRHVGDLRRLAEADAQLLSLLTVNPRFSVLADTLETLCCSPVVLWHAESATFIDSPKTPDWSAQHPDNPTPWKGLSADTSAPMMPTHEDLHVTPVEFNGRFLGAIVVLRPGQPPEGDVRLLSHASSVFSAISFFNDALADAKAHKVEDLVHTVASNRHSPADLRRLKSLTGVDLLSERTTYFVAIDPGPGALGRQFIEQSLSDPVALTRHGEHYCALIQTEQPIERCLAPLCETPRLNDGVLSAAVIDDAAVPDAFSTAHDAAVRLLDAARLLGLHHTVVSAETYGSLGLLLGADDRTLQLITSGPASTLAHYDSEHGTELEATAYAYLTMEHSVSAAASCLYVHPNTVRQRLERIAHILGPEWAKGTRGFDLHVALQARKVRNQPREM